MPPTRHRRCCVPHCPNIQEISKKQFFKIGANLEARDKWRPCKTTAPKSQIMHCCEDHFDLPNDAVNYIRYKYYPGTKLKLRPNVLPRHKLPINVCRLCLNLIYNGDDVVDISETRGNENARVLAALSPEIDLSMTVEPVACTKCFEPIERYYQIKQNILRNEVVIVNCIKSIVKRSPKRLIKACEIDLFDEYNEIKDLLEKDKERTRTLLQDQPMTNNREAVLEEQEGEERQDEEIVIQIEVQEEEKCNVNPIQETSGTHMDPREIVKYETGINDVNGAVSKIQKVEPINFPLENNSTDGQYQIVQVNAEDYDEHEFIKFE